jgi:anthranilate phosphoribosyltransferase
MRELKELTNIISGGQDLNFQDAEMAASYLASPEEKLPAKQEFLIELSKKGETATELAAFAASFRALAKDPGLDEWAFRAIDVCGTGGDGSHTFNISTAVSFIVAAAGVPVFKHGNRSITSKCGSADLIEALGIRLDAPVEVLRRSLDELNFCFFFAPDYHPAFKEIMPVRQALAAQGHRSIFNLLGPLINPGRPSYQLMGVFAQHWVEPIADALDSLDLSAGVVAHCTPEAGLALDELSCAGHNYVAGLGRLRTFRGDLNPVEAGLSACPLSDLRGGDVAENLETLHAIFDISSVSVPKGLIDSILLNAGAALWIAEQANDLQDGIERAREVLVSGQAQEWLQRAQNFYINIS